MKIDITLKITPKMASDAQGHEQKVLVGHLGTHFDVMDTKFPVEYTERPGVVFDVSGVKDRDIDCPDLELDRVEPGMFVAFYSGFAEAPGYGTRQYFHDHPQLSEALIDALVAKGVSIIGLDFAGVRRGKEHTPKDQFCADHGVFVVENLYGLKAVLDAGGRFTAHTYPMNYAEMTGLPCRVVAEIPAADGSGPSDKG